MQSWVLLTMPDITVMNADWSQDKDALIALRTRVFVVEQKVPPELEIDGLDPGCLHVKALEAGQVIGTGRLLPNGFIGRMCVLEAYRGKGVGKRMLDNLIEQAVAAKHARVLLNSQSYAIPFYQKSGFVLDSKEFLEAGIAHRRMVLEFGNQH